MSYDLTGEKPPEVRLRRGFKGLEFLKPRKSTWSEYHVMQTFPPCVGVALGGVLGYNVPSFSQITS